MPDPDLYDVVAVNLTTYKVRLLDTGKSLESADGTVDIAVIRRGVDKEIFVRVPAGKYKNGDSYAGNGASDA